MLKTLFVNLSDMHVKSTNATLLQKKMSCFIQHVSSLKKLGGYERIVILVSGDLAFSGKKSEYLLLDDYFEELATTYELIMCPGNHDHDFSTYSSKIAREQLLKLDPELHDEGSIKVITEGMKDYFDFERKYLTFTPKQITPLSTSVEIVDSEKNITISTLNTAWCSQLHEKGGDFIFPIKFLPTVNKNNVRILFFHHPLAWFEPNNQKALRNLIREDYSIILTGHEHINDSFKITGEENSCLMIEAMPFDDPSIDENGFITFELEDTNVIIRSYLWNEEKFIDGIVSSKHEVMRQNSISNESFTVHYEFYKSLLDIGVSYTHPDKDVLDINDLFIYPNLKILHNDNKFDMKKTTSETLLGNAHSKILLIGDEYCGKSTLLRKFFLDSIEKNNLPLLIEGGAIRNSRIEYDKIISRHVTKQYEDLDSYSFVNSKLKKTLLIDGFDLIKGDNKSINAFLERSYDIFDKIIITVSDTFDFGGSELLGESYFDLGYVKYDIQKLGHRLRYEMVNKWNNIKEECQHDNAALITKNNHAIKTITKVIGRNYVPSTPFFLLTLLQSMESGNTLEVTANTYGYYYEYLITQSLGTASVKKDELDELFNYVKELSHYYFINNLKDESHDKLWDFNLRFCSDYGVKIDFESRFKLLVKAKILERKDGDYYKFKYPYVYYFFIAKYLSDTIRTQETIDIIDKLISSLSRRRSMSILMFLTHHSRDESILDKVVEQSRNLFISSKPARLDLDSAFLNLIVDKMQITAPTFRNQSRLEYRRKIESDRDNAEEGSGSDYDLILNPEDENDDIIEEKDDETSNGFVKAKSEDSANDFLKNLNLTFKSLEILGQLSRNYYGSLKVVQKKKLLEEAIKAPLRSLDYFFTLIDENADTTLGMIETKILEKLQAKSDSSTENEMKETARKFLFEMISSLCFFFITKISASIGSVNLQNVISDVCDDIDSNAGKLIKLATMLDVNNAVSVEQIKSFIATIQPNHLTKKIMTALILNYLYMFERSEKESQQICSLAGINYSTVSKQIGLDRMK